MDHLPSGICTQRKVQLYEFMFSFLFFSLEVDLRRFNYAEAEKSQVLRLRQQPIVFLLYHFSVVGDGVLACDHGPGLRASQH